MTDVVILYSGGFDSYLMREMISDEYDVKCVYYAHGADSEEVELETLPDFVEVRRVDWLNLPGIDAVSKKSDMLAGPVYIPGRNLVFSALSACQDLPDEIWMGTLFDEYNDQATDKNEPFVTKTMDAINYAVSPFRESEIKVRFPFVESKDCKASALAYLDRVARVNGDRTLMERVSKNSTSCWHARQGGPCGRCKQCLKRYLVFAVNGFFEDVEFQDIHPLDNVELMNEYLLKEDPNLDERCMIYMLTDIHHHVQELKGLAYPLDGKINLFGFRTTSFFELWHEDVNLNLP